MMTKGSFGIPEFSAVVLAINSKRSVHRVTVGLPRFSSSTESWILHVVHDPQSPMAFITTSAVLVNSSMAAASAASATLGF